MVRSSSTVGRNKRLVVYGGERGQVLRFAPGGWAEAKRKPWHAHPK